MNTTITTATATYRIRTIGTGRDFGHFAIVVANGRSIYTSNRFPTAQAANNVAERWIARQA